MIVTTEQVKGNKINLFADGELAGILDAAFWYSQGIYDGEEIDEEHLSEIFAEAKRRKALHAAMSALTYRPHSEKELYAKLRQKGYPPDACDYAIERALELRLIDDNEYAESLTQTLLERKGYAPARIRDELLHKGFERGIAEKILESLDFDPVMRIIDLLNTKFSGFSENEKSRKKTVSALIRLGYDINDIKRALREADNL